MIDPLDSQTVKLLEHIQSIEDKYQRALYGYNGNIGIVARVKKLEETIDAIYKLIMVVTGVIVSAVVLQIINIVVTHWK